MAWYTELWCDGKNCRSGSDNEGPQGSNRREVARVARKAGWIKTALGWLCPQCAALSQQGEER